MIEQASSVRLEEHANHYGVKESSSGMNNMYKGSLSRNIDTHTQTQTHTLTPDTSLYGKTKVICTTLDAPIHQALEEPVVDDQKSKTESKSWVMGRRPDDNTSNG